MLRLLALLAPASLLGLGCSGQESEALSRVTGHVTLANGKPLTGGRITFSNAAGKVSVGQIKADGTYEAVGVPHGECRVAIENLYLKGWSPPRGSEAMPNAAENAALKYIPINAKYAKPETSGLSTNVTDDKHTFDVELK